MRCTDRVKAVLDIARQRGYPNTSTMDVLCAIMEEGSGIAANALGRRGVTVQVLEAITQAHDHLTNAAHSAQGCSASRRELEELLIKAHNEASSLPKPPGLSEGMWPVVGTEHLLLAILRSRDRTSYALRTLLASKSTTPEEICSEVWRLLGGSSPPTRGTAHKEP